MKKKGKRLSAMGADRCTMADVEELMFGRVQSTVPLREERDKKVRPIKN